MTITNVLKTIINIPKITINGWYKPFPNGWFIIVLTTLLYQIFQWPTL